MSASPFRKSRASRKLPSSARLNKTYKRRPGQSGRFAPKERDQRPVIRTIRPCVGDCPPCSRIDLNTDPRRFECPSTMPRSRSMEAPSRSRALDTPRSGLGPGFTRVRAVGRPVWLTRDPREPGNSDFNGLCIHVGELNRRSIFKRCQTTVSKEETTPHAECPLKKSSRCIPSIMCTIIVKLFLESRKDF